MMTDSQVFRNFYTFEKDIPLTNGAGGAVFGRSITQYEIRRLRDVKNLGSFLGYVVMMRQRVIVPPKNSYEPGPTSKTSYDDYPAILVNEINITANNNAKLTLQKIFPKTLNSQISTSVSHNDGTSNTTSHQNTTGSANTNVNTFGVSVSAGAFGPAPVFNVGLDYSHSWEDTNSSNQTRGRARSSDHNDAESAEMSIKDWASYGALDDTGVQPSWVWGQSYPWDVIQYNQGSGSDIDLPSFVVDRMLSNNNTLVLPPSQLSLFGLDFTMTAGWVIDFPQGVTENETVTIAHKTSSYSASHSINNSTLEATLDTTALAKRADYSAANIDLSTYALEPVTSAESGNGAAIGFTANQFTYPPTSATSNFKIVSPANNLEVTGSGFTSGITTDFSHTPTFSVTFKISDTTVNYSLMFMHWIGEASGNCELHWTLNGHTGVLLVSSTEGDGGQNNISAIELRNTNFTSINFHDYLLQGTNKVEVTVVPVGTTPATHNYTLFAIALGQA